MPRYLVFGDRTMSYAVQLPNLDRRRRPRTELSCRIYVLRGGSAEYHEARTTNLNSLGFHFVSSEQCTPGEQLQCVISIPAPRRSLLLECDAVVIRVETRTDGYYGTACEIQRYRARKAPSVLELQ